ncbi:MAG: SPOR domain-containing protein, partial [Bdellovibrionales bacterium]|nr:SPOR domain-containing protein [Bdellovibrionales bacterium]
QGLSRALEATTVETVRLPIAEPIADPADETANSAEAIEMAAASGAAGAPSADAEPEFDFSKSEPVAGSENAKAEAAPAAGFSSKPALNLFQTDGADAAEALAALEADKQGAQAAVVDKKPEQKSVDKKALASGLSQISPPLRKESEQPPAEAKITPLPPKPSAESSPARIKVESAGTQLASGWYVQAAATRTQQDAAVLVKKFNDAGLSGVVEQAKVRDKVYYRVLVGPYGDKNKALSGRAAVKKSGVTGGEPFLKHVE